MVGVMRLGVRVVGVQLICRGRGFRPLVNSDVPTPLPGYVHPSGNRRRDPESGQVLPNRHRPTL